MTIRTTPRTLRFSALAALALIAAAAACGGPIELDQSPPIGGGKADGASPCLTRAGVCIHVDLTGQRLVAYRDGVAEHQTTVATGLPWTPTFPGAYTIQLRRRSQTMSDGATYSVFTEWVQYFDLQGLGRALHSAPWRAEEAFGSPGSHGCVNLRNVDAERLWDLAGIGTPVYVTGNTPNAVDHCPYDRCEGGQRCGDATNDPCQCGDAQIPAGTRCAITLDGHGSVAGATEPPPPAGGADTDDGAGDDPMDDAGESCFEGRCEADRVCVGGRWKENTSCAAESFSSTRFCNADGWCDWP